jgi:RTX calcium-binding nonapeptide repeat (4 copies)
VTVAVSDGVHTATTTITVRVGIAENDVIAGAAGADLVLGLNGDDQVRRWSGQ